MIGILWVVVMISVVRSSTDINAFANKFYRARVEKDTTFVTPVVSDTLRLTYPLIEDGDFKYTDFAIKRVEKVDSMEWNIEAELTEGYKKWDHVGIVKETAKIVWEKGAWKVVSIVQSYVNTAIPENTVKDSENVYLLKEKGFVFLDKPSLSDGIRLNVHVLDSPLLVGWDTCPPVKIIPNFFHPFDGEPEKKIITVKHNMFKFCFIRGGEEGAAGHTYKYYYFIPVDFRDIVLSFVIENTNCDNYDEKYQRECREKNLKRNQYPFMLLGIFRKIK